MRANKFPERVNVAVSRETARKVRFLKESGKDVPEILRSVLEAALSEIVLPADKKTG